MLAHLEPVQLLKRAKSALQLGYREGQIPLKLPDQGVPVREGLIPHCQGAFQVVHAYPWAQHQEAFISSEAAA